MPHITRSTTGDHTMEKFSKFTTWKNMDGTISSDKRSQLDRIKSSNSKLVYNNAPELADALIDLVLAAIRTGIRNTASFGYAVHVLGNSGIKINLNSPERRKNRRFNV